MDKLTYNPTGLNELAKNVVEANRRNGFWELHDNVSDKQKHNPTKHNGQVLQALNSQKIALIHSELSEALEAMRKERYTEDGAEGILANYKTGSPEWINAFVQNVKDTTEDEIADALIRILDYCGGNGIDIEFHVMKKLEFNETRGQKHGNKAF